jgi:DNA-binding IclR family transcriptional regulator
MEQDNSGISFLDRVCAILNCFEEAHPILTLTEISQRLHLPKSTTHRLLTALENQGMVQKDPFERGYQLGYQLIRWGTTAQASLDLRNLALPILTNLAQKTGESTMISVRDGRYGIWLELVESHHPVRLAIHVGQRNYLHAGASSKILLAFLPDEELERLIPQLELPRLMPHTISCVDELRKELELIRQKGYALSYEETDPGAMGISAPVYDHSGRPIAGIGLAAPITRIPFEKADEYAPLVVKAGIELSQKLGCPPFRLISSLK